MGKKGLINTNSHKSFLEVFNHKKHARKSDSIWRSGTNLWVPKRLGRGENGEYPDWCPADWCRPIDADLLMPTFWCQSLLMPVPFDAQQARLMPDPIDVGLIHALSSKQFHFETLLRPGPIDARPSWCQLSLLMPVPIDARPHWCPFRLV